MQLHAIEEMAFYPFSLPMTLPMTLQFVAYDIAICFEQKETFLKILALMMQAVFNISIE